MKILGISPADAAQIKNVVTIAHTLASKQATQLTIDHLQAAVQLCQDFENDVQGAIREQQIYN